MNITTVREACYCCTSQCPLINITVSSEHVFAPGPDEYGELVWGDPLEIDLGQVVGFQDCLTLLCGQPQLYDIGSSKYPDSEPGFGVHFKIDAHLGTPEGVYSWVEIAYYIYDLIGDSDWPTRANPNLYVNTDFVDVSAYNKIDKIRFKAASEYTYVDDSGSEDPQIVPDEVFIEGEFSILWSNQDISITEDI